MRGRLQFQLDGALEPQTEQLLRVADQEVDGLVGPVPRDDGGDPDEVVLPLDDDLTKLRSQNGLHMCCCCCLMPVLGVTAITCTIR